MPGGTDGIRRAGAEGRPRDFRQLVERIIKSIPKGRVLSYGQVAALAGKPGGARAVVWALHGMRGAPWWRVIRSDGQVAEEMAPRQVPRLRAEGVKVRGRRVSRQARAIGESQTCSQNGARVSRHSEQGP